jgi:hypothetical protein
VLEPEFEWQSGVWVEENFSNRNRRNAPAATQPSFTTPHLLTSFCPNFSLPSTRKSTMAKVSSSTVRALEIPLQVDELEFFIVAKCLASRSIQGGGLLSFSAAIPGDDNPVISFAEQFERHTGTITLPSEKHKTQALASHDTQWRFDDKFDGVTVPYSPKDSDIEYETTNVDEDEFSNP